MFSKKLSLLLFGCPYTYFSLKTNLQEWILVSRTIEKPLCGYLGLLLEFQLEFNNQCIHNHAKFGLSRNPFQYLVKTTPQGHRAVLTVNISVI